MNRWLLCAALAVCGCGGSANDSDSMVGTWKGSASGLTVTMVVDQTLVSGGVTGLVGTLNTNNPACFTNASMSALLSNNVSLTVSASGAGSTSKTVLQFDGERSGDTVTGYVELTGLDSDACSMERMPLTLTHQ